jgi:GNAT superfamily N-acetyltransferase
MNVKLLEPDAQLDRVAAVLLEARNAFAEGRLIAQINEQRQRGYEIAYVESEGKVLCVAGFIVAIKLAWGRHIYIDDFVTAQAHRRCGAGAFLIEWLKEHARERGCQKIHLDSRVTNFTAHRFYLRHGFDIASHHFSIDLSSSSVHGLPTTTPKPLAGE